MKILVLGGTGTISRYIVNSLAQMGHDLILLNHHEKACYSFSNVKVELCDRKNYPSFIDTCRRVGPFDCVYDMITFTPDEARSSVEAFRNNTKQLIFCSTVDVYTKTGAHYPVKEGMETKPFESFPYAFMKKQCENIFMDAHMRGDFQTTILRPAHTYSEGSPKSHLLFNVFQTAAGASYLLDRIKKGKPIILHGNGMSVWSITHGSDTASAFVGALCNEKAYGKAYTVAGDECMCYRKYFDAVAEEMHAPAIRFVFIPMDLLLKLEPEKARLCGENFMYNNVFDNAAAKEDLGMTSNVSWHEGIRRSLDFFENHGGYEDSDKPEYAFYDHIVEKYTAMCEKLVKYYVKE